MQVVTPTPQKLGELFCPLRTIPELEFYTLCWANLEVWEPPQCWKKNKSSRSGKPFSEQLSEFRGTLGATLGIALMTQAMRKSNSWSHSRNDSWNWREANISARILGAFFSQMGVVPATRWTNKIFEKKQFEHVQTNFGASCVEGMWHDLEIKKIAPASYDLNWSEVALQGSQFWVFCDWTWRIQEQAAHGLGRSSCRQNGAAGCDTVDGTTLRQGVREGLAYLWGIAQLVGDLKQWRHIRENRATIVSVSYLLLVSQTNLACDKSRSDNQMSVPRYVFFGCG